MTNFTNSYFINGELELLLEELNLQISIRGKEASNDSDAYVYFINQCREKSYPENTIVEGHHIIPKHAGGTNEKSNLIELSVRDHIIAHWLLWKLRNSENDKRAFLFRVSTPEERRKMQIEFTRLNVQKYKENGQYFHDPKFQSRQGKKGGSKGGSAGTEAQKKARQKVGQEWGPIVGKKNQGSNLKEFLTKYSIWEFIGCKNSYGVYFPKSARLDNQGVDSIGRAQDRPFESIKGDGLASLAPEGYLTAYSDFFDTEFYIVLTPKETFKELAQNLCLFAPGSINMNNVASMHKLITSNTKRIYGWRLHTTLTRSEVETGALDKLSFELFTEEILPE